MSILIFQFIPATPKVFKEVILITQSECQEVIWRKGMSGCQVKGTALERPWDGNEVGMFFSGKWKKEGQSVWGVEGEGESDEDATGEVIDVVSY